VARPAAPQPGVTPVRPAPAANAISAAFGSTTAPLRQGPTDLSDLFDDDIKLTEPQEEDLLEGHGPPAKKKKTKKKKKKRSSGGVVRGNEAGLLARWAGNFIDNLVLFGAFFVGALIFAPRPTGPAPPTDAEVEAALMKLGGLMVVIILVQSGLIASSGQSLGKMAMGTQIANDDDNDPPGFARGVVVRWWLNSVLCFIPFYALIDVLMIFSEDRRCLHDQIAGTRVISVR
jgi:uncharacterized RDD family membrane protein YckC